MSHKTYLRRCFALAARGGKHTLPNPQVGALLVHNNKIIGEGYHRMAGHPHAEVNCLANVTKEDQHLIAHSTLYVSLEPCCHMGKTPPCTELIIRHKIPRVVISNIDPTDKVRGKGIQLLRDHGVEVISGLLPEEGNRLIQKFATNALLKRPFILLKIAKSKDNFIGKEGKQVWITSKATGIYTHKIRSEYHGILIGSNTAIIDTPALTTRHYPGDNPAPILLDRSQRISDDHPLFARRDKKVFYFTHGQRKFANKNVLSFDIGDSKNPLSDVMKTLFRHEIYSIIVEGGKSIIQSFIKERLWDEAIVITGKKILGQGLKAPTIHGRLLSKRCIDKDTILRIKAED